VSTPLEINGDRLLPADSSTRPLARRIYESVKYLPVISPHSHVDPAMLAKNSAFADPSTLLITSDHYVTRILQSQGIRLEVIGCGAPDGSRAIWRAFCENWTAFDGTSTGLWLAEELSTVFGVAVTPSGETADIIYDNIADLLTRDEFRPQALLAKQDVEFLATTDDPLSTLVSHDALAANDDVTTRVVPTFRPDAYLDVSKKEWVQRVQALALATNCDTSDLGGFLDALRIRRTMFIEHGAVSADHGMVAPFSVRLDDATAARLYVKAISRSASSDEMRLLNGHLFYSMAEMSSNDGLVMTVHAGVFRNHHTPTFERLGPDGGHDFPVPTSFVEGLRPILNDFGTHPGFSLVLFTVDESTWSRELAPLASFFPSVSIGAPWWFLDAPDAFLRFRSAVTEIAGFANYAGFIDDTRALCSLRVRHDVARRVDSGFLARYVVEGRVTEERAFQIAAATVSEQPKQVFKI
jgi:glucuronate isomerase